MTDSLTECVFGPWDHEFQQRRAVRLDPPVVQSLDAVDGRHVNVRRLSPALRALGAASASGACRADDAIAVLRPVLAAHQRGMLARKHGHLHGQSDSLVAARAALRQASAGRDDTVLDYVSAYAGIARVLAEALGAIAAAAEESAAAGTAARRVWPQVVDLVLDAARAEPRLFVEHTWGDHARATLIPVPVGGRGYLTSELVGEPHPWWDRLAWAPQVERWLEAGPTRRSALDHLVIPVSQLDVPDQVRRGLVWVERAVEMCAEDRSSTFTLPEWLHARRADVHEDDNLVRWQRMVDMLVVAGDTRVADLAD